MPGCKLGFSADENLADLEVHEAEFAARQAFAYTVLELDETYSLGCACITPRTKIMRRAGVPDEGIGRVGDLEAVVDLWVRPESVDEDLERVLLAAVITSLRDDLPFARVVFGPGTLMSGRCRSSLGRGFDWRGRTPSEIS